MSTLKARKRRTRAHAGARVIIQGAVVMRQPPGVSVDARSPEAPNLMSLYVGDGWIHALAAALQDLERYGAAEPMLILPGGHDPVAFRWPVSGRHVAIYGCLDTPRLRRLMAALLRDGAVVIAGLDAYGNLHTACDRIVREAA